eukprot:jgi/Phyca11/21443/fgenesh1_pg.PHYCAscaffold_95_\
MGMICVNQNEEANVTTSTPRCVADWVHTQEQVIHASYLLAGLVLVALIWTVASRRQRKALRKGELGFSLNCRRWARTSRTAAIINRPLQLLVSFGILGLTLSRLNSYDVTEWSYYTVLGLYAIAIVDDVLYSFNPLTIDNLISLYKLRQIGNPPYTPKPDSKHVLIIGNPSFAQLSSILRELFHADHISDTDTQQLEAVVLGERKSKFTKPLIAKLKGDPIFTSRVTYIAGNATRSEDLERALARSARAVFVFPDKLTGDAATEDAMNIMRVLSTKRYVGPTVRFVVMVLRAESARHMLAAGVHPDDIICENVIKMGSDMLG